MTHTVLKCGLLIGSLLLSYQFLWFRLQGLESLVTHIVFWGMLGLYVGILLTTAFSKLFRVRLVWTLIFIPAYFIYESSQRVFGEPLSYSAFITLVSARGFVGDTLKLYGAQMFIPLLQCVMMTCALLLPVRTQAVVRLPLAAWYPVGGIALLCCLLFFRGGYGASGLPSMFAGLSYASLYLLEEVTMKVSRRQEVSLQRVDAPKARDIVLIVDESVRGDYLDINAPTGVTSGLKRSLSTATIHNFGLAVSASHCSDATNLILRYGSTRERIKEHIQGMPSIWEYARVAGFSPVYVDAQRTGGDLHNRMDDTERRQIDDLVQFDSVPVLQRDMATVDELVERLSNEVPEFIYVNKVGAHFPVHDKFPDSFLHYKPVLPRGALGSVSDTGDRVGLFSGDWAAYRNSYRNTLLWNTGEFFERLLDKAELQNAIVIYTSDHGQNFHERDEPGFNTHCSISPTPEEGLVPLVAIVGSNVGDPGFEKSAGYHFNRASQFGLFPTILKVMGFEASEVSDTYATSLFDDVLLDYSFNYTFNARLGAPQQFMSIELEQVQMLE